MNEKKRKIIPFIGAFLLSILILLLFSSSTSPLFEIVYSDYYNNPSSTGFLVGKLWKDGVIPYRDLYVVNGPLYYLIQMLGWSLGGRQGIFVLQIINMTIGLWLLFKAVSLVVEEKYAWIIMVLSAMLFSATLNGGNSSVEYCFVLSAGAVFLGLLNYTEPERCTMMNLLLIGTLAGLAAILQITGGGIVYGVFLVLIFDTFAKKQGARKISKILILFAGFILVIAPFILYFVSNGALKEMINGAFVQCIRFMWTEAFSTKLVVHKLVKSVPVICLLIVAILLYKKDRTFYRFMIIVSVSLLCFTVTGQGYWYQYIPVIVTFAILVAVLLKNKVNKIISVAFGLLLLIGISILPVKNYISFISNGDIKVYYDLIDQIDEHQEASGENTVFLVDVPAFVYLETESIPTYYYLVQHSEYNKTNPEMQSIVTEYMVSECKDGMAVIQSTGGTYLYIGNYAMSNNYYYGRTMLYVYEYVDNMETHEH